MLSSGCCGCNSEPGASAVHLAIKYCSYQTKPSAN